MPQKELSNGYLQIILYEGLMQQKYGFCFFMTERQHTYRSSCPNLWSCPLVPHGFVLGSFSEVVKAGHSTVPPCHYHPVTGWEKVFKFNGILLKTMQSDFYRETNACVTTDCKRRLPCCVCVWEMCNSISELWVCVHLLGVNECVLYAQIIISMLTSAASVIEEYYFQRIQS